MKNTVNQVWAIAQKNKEGFTLDANLQPITSGYVVATNLTQNSFGVEGCANAVAIAFFQDAENFDGVGGWLNTDNGQYYFDAVKVFKSKKQAEKYAQEQGQIAYFHLNTGREIKTPSVTITGGIPSNVGFSHTNGVIVR